MHPGELGFGRFAVFTQPMAVEPLGGSVPLDMLTSAPVAPFWGEPFGESTKEMMPGRIAVASHAASVERAADVS